MTRAVAWAAILVALAAPAPAATDWSKARRITVVATNYKFEPASLTFKRGVPYRLRVENRGSELHEFNAADLFKSADIRNPDALNPDKTEIEVHPGQTKDLYFVPKQAGRFRLICPDHDWAGMVGEITVE